MTAAAHAYPSRREGEDCRPVENRISTFCLYPPSTRDRQLLSIIPDPGVIYSSLYERLYTRVDEGGFPGDGIDIGARGGDF